MTNNNFYVYVHMRKTDDSVFYVGKGCRYRSTSKESRNPHWHNIVNKHGFIAEIVETGLTCEEACAAEIKLIKNLKDQGIKLCNRTDGGEGAQGFKHSQETKETIRILKTGVKYSKEANEKKRQVLIGRKVSDLSIAKLIERNKTMVLSEETKKRLSEIRKGKNTGPRSEETKRKMSEGKKRGWAAKKQMQKVLTELQQKEAQNA